MEVPRKVGGITGANGGGRGRAVARRLAREGASLVGADINEGGGRSQSGTCGVFPRSRKPSVLWLGGEKTSAKTVERTPLANQLNKHLQTTLTEAAKMAPRNNVELAMLHCKERHKGNAHKPGGLPHGGRYVYCGLHRNMARQLAEKPCPHRRPTESQTASGVSHSLARDMRQGPRSSWLHEAMIRY